jgi:zinc protease
MRARLSFVREESGVREFRLDNGLKVLLVENRVAPVATVLVLYKVGSRNEAVGYTGSTHLLEHMMFKGTPLFNKGRNTQIAATLHKIGADFNATTWYDRTNYFETVPSDQIELAIRLEADRMRNSYIADADRQSEMTVVRNELERGQNEPSSVLDEAVYAIAFREHPYHHPTIGWRTDVEGVATSRLKEFYDTYYHPNNATVVVVGDFTEEGVLDLIARYFGEFPASTDPSPEVYTAEPPQEGERRVVIRRAGELALVQIAYHTPGALGQMSVLSNAELAERALNPSEQNDIYPLIVLSVSLSHGITSRFYQGLVETQLAVSASTNVDQHRDPGLFTTYAMVTPGVEPAKAEQVMLDELARVAAEGLTESEIAKAKQQIAAHEAFSRDGTFNVAVQMSEAEAVADWRFFQTYGENIARVTTDDVKRVAAKYFTEENRTVGHFIPKTAGGGNGAPAGAAQLYPADNSGAERRGVQFHHEPGARGTEPTIPVAAGAAVTTGRFADRVNRSELATGATLLVLENHATPTFSLRGSLRAGSYFEPVDKPGLAQITAEMLERGTNKRTKLELAGDLEAAGADLGLSADAFALNVGARALSKDLRLVMTALAEQLMEPAFPADELEKLKQQTIAGIQEQQTDTRYRAYEKFSNLLYEPRHPYHATPGDELIKSIGSITVDDLRNFYHERSGGRSLILSLAGDVDPAESAKLFRELFEGFAGPANVGITDTGGVLPAAQRREIVLMKDKASVDVLLGLPAPLHRDADDFYAASLANSALGESTLSSRLGMQVRDIEGLTYGINSRFRSPSLVAGAWYVGVTLNPTNVERAIASTLEVLRKYVAEGITPEELADQKSAAVGSFKVGMATNGGLARVMWNAEFFDLGADFVDRYEQIVNTVSIDQVNTAIRKYFRPDELTIVIAGDYSDQGL